MLLHLLLCEVRKAVSGQRSIENERGGGEHELSIDAHSKFAPVLLELPGVNATMRGQAEIDAAVGHKILRRTGRRTLREVRGRPYDRHAHLGPDRNCYHVLRDSFPRPYTGVDLLGHYVGKAV